MTAVMSNRTFSPLEDRYTRLPVTVVTGFLGSGKTTLLNHILSRQRGLKVAVIVNEMGEIGIDGDLIIATADDIVELGNGCICCSLNKDLVDAVARVLHRDQKIDYLVVESTGVADPLPIILTLLRPELRNLLRVDSIVTVADAEAFSLELFASKSARNQMLYADVILLNKCDLVGADRLRSVERKIHDVKAEAQIIQTTRCRVALPLILGVELFQPDRYLTDSAGPLPDQRHHSRGKTHQPHLLEDGFESVSFEANKPFSTDKFQRFLEQPPNSVFRAKGVLWIDEGYHRYIFHLVGKRFTLDETGLSSPMRNRLVLIGQNLDHKALHDQLEGCLCDIGGGA